MSERKRNGMRWANFLKSLRRRRIKRTRYEKSFQAFSTLCHEKDKIMSLEASSTTRHHARGNNNRSSGGVMSAPLASAQWKNAF